SSKTKGKKADKDSSKRKRKHKEAEEQEQEKEEEGAGEVGGHEVYMATDEGDDNEDAAIYKSSADEEGDNILFFQAAAWNRMSLVLHDKGVLRFVKYVSRRARGDRWDVCGTFEVEEEDEEEEEEEEEEYIDPLANDTEEEWKGFSASEDSDSD
ncbi:hypothetical protein CHU98_g7684, partial [Xylaria longipes]